MKRKLISSGSSFEAKIGYSRAVVAGDWIFVSGTTGFDYTTMTISPETLASQTDQCFRNIDAALRQADSSLAGRRARERVRAAERRWSSKQCWPGAPVLARRRAPGRDDDQRGLLADQRMKIEIEVTALKQTRER